MHVEDVMGQDNKVDEIVDIYNRVCSGGSALASARI
jgi:hypothetical protein